MSRVQNENSETKPSIRESNRTKIIEAASKIFASNGYTGTTVQQIAEHAELPKANVLYYFKSKEGIYGAVLSEILSLWNSCLDDATVEDEPSEIFTRYIFEKMELSRTYPDASKIFAMEIIKGMPYLSEDMKHNMSEWFESRVALINEWINLGKMQAVDPQVLLFHIWSSTQHYADFSAQITSLRGEAMTVEDYDKASRYLATSILAGCGLTPKFDIV
ncbi:MAG: TetR family transcriptional regulator [Alteromonadaceae bacterium]|nr:TetR family transcriptional regulator [Alteromonadaceae bacterium]